MRSFTLIFLCSFLLVGSSICENPIGYEVTRLKNIPTLQLGEGPHWDIESQSLYFVDITGRTINCYKYRQDRLFTATIDKPSDADDIGFIIPVKGKRNEFIIGQGSKVVRIHWNSVSPTYRVTEILVETEDIDPSINRMNDAKADGNGRLFFGTMNRNVDGQTSAFYLKAKNRALVQIFSSVGISNGITWNLRNNKMFYIDTRKENIQVMDYDSRTGNVGNPSVFIDFGARGYTMPDGMTIDCNDYLYAAIFNGNTICRVNPRTREIDMKIIIPDITNTTSVAFGGPMLNELFVTSGTFGIDPTSEAFAQAGGLYKVKFSDTFIRGLPMNKVNL